MRPLTLKSKGDLAFFCKPGFKLFLGEGDSGEDASSDEANMLSVQSDVTSTTLTIMALDGKGQPLTSKKAVKVKVEDHRGKVVAATASCGSGRGGRNQPYDRLMLHFQVWSLTHFSVF